MLICPEEHEAEMKLENNINANAKRSNFIFIVKECNF